MSVTADASVVPAASSSSHSPEFTRAARAILVAMVILIVALTGVLVETTWGQAGDHVDLTPPDPGSFAQR
jgi:hypothetical protein